MSIAWGSLVLLILLLPGVLFFVGIYWPEQFTREAELKSPFGQLAGALLIAFLVHGLAYSVIAGLCGGPIPCISIELLFTGSSLRSIGCQHFYCGRKYDCSVPLVDLHIRDWHSRNWDCLGAVYGTLVATGRIRRFSRHNWIYDLSTDGLTYAYVLTHVRQEQRVLMYKGFVRAFGLRQDGKFSYIVLADVARLYLILGEDVATTSAPEVQRVIGASSGGSIIGFTEPTGPKRRVHSVFVIEGEDIANVVFDVLATDAEPMPREDLRRMIKEEVRAAGIALSDEQIEGLLGPP